MSPLHSFRIYSILAIILLLPLLTVTARSQNRVDPAKVSIVYRVPRMEQAIVRAGVVFDDSSATPLAFDAYLPRNLARGERRPAIIFISGAERVREWRWFITWGQVAAAHGLVGIVADKRYPRGFDGIRSGFEDTEKLLSFLRAQGARVGVDPQRICLWTFSAGGRLTSAGLQPGNPVARCLVSFYGVLDLSSELTSASSEAEREKALRQFSPLHALEALAASGGKSPPVFIARAGRDAPSINTGIDRFTAAALRLNMPLTVMNYAEGDHGFDGLNNTPQSRAIIEAALRFVQEWTAAR
jgi:acetyl esterase/lipase